MSAVGEGLADRIGDYLTFIPDGSISGGCLIDVINIDNICRDKPYQTTWTIPLPSARSAEYAFSNSGLESFTADLSSVANGEGAFDQCLSLSSFNSTLPSLYDGTAMFGGCSLDKESAIRVLNSLPTYSSGTHALLIGMDRTNEGDEDIQTAIDSAEAKGWNVTPEWSYPGCGPGYFPALFLESSGGQRIDTRIKSTGDSIIEVDMVPIKYNYVNTIFGDSQLSALSGGKRAPRTYLSFNYNNAYERAIAFVYGGNQVQADGSNLVYYYAGGTTAVKLGNRYKFRADKNNLFINGNPAKRYRFGPFTYEDFESAYSLMLFGGRHQPNGYVYSYTRMYEFSLKNGIPADSGGIGECRLIPALDPEGTPCMFDKITQKPFYNGSGSGKFIVGLTPQQALTLANLPVTEDETLTVSLPKSIIDATDKVFVPAIKSALDTAADNKWNLVIRIYDDALPDGSIPADFLESTGKQYIDTGITLSNASLVRCEFASVDPDDCYVYGAKTTWATDDVSAYASANGSVTAVFGNQFLRKTFSGTKHSILANESIIKIDDSELALSEQQPFETPSSATLFARKVGETTIDAKFKGRVYNFSIANQTAPQANYVPIITADGVPAMWDYVSKTAKLNDGTDSFIVGLTSAQATKLSNLPKGGGEPLTISLPQGDVTDAGEVYTEAIKTAVDTATKNGWKLDIRTYGDELPGGCVPCEFLESTGTQWLDTDLTLGSECEVSCEYKLMGTSWTTNQYAYGTGDAFNLNAFDLLAYYPSAQELLAYVGGNGIVPNNVSTDAEINTLVQTVLNNETLTVNENEIAFSSPATSFESAHSATLFSKGGEDRASGLQIYNFSVSRSGTKQCNYTPIITAAGVPAMWDSVTHTAKTNADTTEGAADFVVGLTAENALKLANLPVTTDGTLTISLPSEVVDENGVLQNLEIFTALSAAAAKGWSFILRTHDGTAVETTVPAGYMECEFLESTGEQFINTGIRPLIGLDDCTVGIELDCIVTGPGSATNCMIAGCGQSGSAWFSPYRWWHEEHAVWAYGHHTNQHEYPVSSPYNNRLHCSMNFLDSGIMEYTINGTERGPISLPKTSSNLGNYMYLFGGSQAGSVPKASGRIWSAKISDGAEIVRDYIPTISPTGVPCMWDSVSTTAKTNNGTGKFVAGMTAAQAVQLANLPEDATDKTITVSLPQAILNADGEITDAAVNAALNKAAGNGWDITLQYYTES